MLLTTIAVMTSCLNSSSDTASYNDAAITSFTLGTLTRYQHQTKKDGTDSIVKKTINGSSYRFHIDQNLKLIYNTDSLPIGTDVAHVLCTVNTKNYGNLFIQDVEDENVLYIYSSSDTINFTSQRKFIVYSSDNTGNNTEYLVNVNVHKEEGSDFVWHQLADSEELQMLTNLKAHFWNGQMYVAGDIGEENITFYVDKEGKLTPVSASSNELPEGIKCWIGATKEEIYALSTDNKLMISRDGGTTWEEDILDEDPSMLPVRDIAFVSYPLEYAENTEYALMVGNRSKEEYPQETIAMVWRKIVDNDEYTPEGIWTYLDRSENNQYTLPRLENLSLVAYDDGILAIGGENIGTDDASPAYTQIYQSRDDGITWKANKSYQLPDAFDDATDSMAMATDDDNNLWLFCGKTGQIWRGRLNKLGWVVQE